MPMRRLKLTTSWGPLLVVGGSRAGEGTTVLLPQFRLALDAGHLLRALVPMDRLFLSHGHTDHWAALPAWASQRQLQNLGPAQVLVPSPLADQVRQLLALTAAMEHSQAYPVEVVPVEAGDQVSLRADLQLRFFPTSHWTPTLGTVLLWHRKQLKAGLAGLSPQQLAQLRRQGQEIAEKVEVPLLAYLGDSGPEVLEQEPWLAQVEVLVVECTFLKPKDLARSRQFGHMHLSHLQAFGQRASNRHWVLIHLSRRHRLAPGTRTLRQTLQREGGPALHFLNVEWP